MVAMRTYTKVEVAQKLGISPARVKQLVGELGLVPARGPRGAFKFEQYHITAMRKRNTKPGPKANGRANGDA